jgi:hypothetical protein
MNTIDLDTLSTVTGGAAGNTGITGGIKGVPNNKVPALKTRRVGNVKLIGNQTLDQVYWESKPF